MLPKNLADTEKVFTSPRFDVHAIDLPRRSGGTMRREVVVPPDAVVVLPLADARTVVMIRNERFAAGQTLWELPAGTLEPQEDPKACAARELTEETGYVAQRLTALLEFYPSPGFCTERMTAFWAEGLTYRAQDLDETERITAEAVELSEAMRMVRHNRIRDGKTIAVLLYHAAFKKESV